MRRKAISSNQLNIETYKAVHKDSRRFSITDTETFQNTLKCHAEDKTLEAILATGLCIQFILFSTKDKADREVVPVGVPEETKAVEAEEMIPAVSVMRVIR